MWRYEMHGGECLLGWQGNISSLQTSCAHEDSHTHTSPQPLNTFLMFLDTGFQRSARNSICLFASVATWEYLRKK